MEVKHAFKQTEVGVIPDDWSVTRIGDVSQIFGRIGFRGYAVKDIVRQGEGAITISPSNIQDNKTDFSTCTYISWSKYEESPEIKIKNGDILLVKTGSTVGKVAIVQKLPEQATINPQIVVLKKIEISHLFLGYSMCFDVVQKQLSATVVGGALPTLSQRQIAEFKLALPPTKAERDAIAKALSDADALIESLAQLLAKKRQLKQGTMQQLLTGKKRLPGFSRSAQSYRPTKFGMMPADWAPMSLERVAAFITKGSTPTTYGFNWQSQGILFLRSECVAGRGLDLSQSMFISDKAHQGLRRSKFAPAIS
jgi:type I restriction enzyme, S subunit